MYMNWPNMITEITIADMNSVSSRAGSLKNKRLSAIFSSTISLSDSGLISFS